MFNTAPKKQILAWDSLKRLHLINYKTTDGCYKKIIDGSSKHNNNSFMHISEKTNDWAKACLVSVMSGDNGFYLKTNTSTEKGPFYATIEDAWFNMLDQASKESLNGYQSVIEDFIKIAKVQFNKATIIKQREDVSPIGNNWLQTLAVFPNGHSLKRYVFIQNSRSQKYLPAVYDKNNQAFAFIAEKDGEYEIKSKSMATSFNKTSDEKEALILLAMHHTKCNPENMSGHEKMDVINSIKSLYDIDVNFKSFFGLDYLMNPVEIYNRTHLFK